MTLLPADFESAVSTIPPSRHNSLYLYLALTVKRLALTMGSSR